MSACGSAQSTSSENQGFGDPASSSAFARIRLDLPWPDLTKDAAAVGGGEKDAAVVVAIERYDFVPGVPGAKENATAWYNLFTKTLKIPVGNVKLVPQRSATREGILSALEYAAGKAQPGGRVWFVFIGHGAPSNGDGLLLGVDVRQTAESLEARSLRRGDALAALNRSQGQPVLVLDACFSGRTGGGDAVVEGLMPVRNADLPPAGRAIVMTAAAGDQYAGPLPGAAKPAFSYLALGALRGWGDANGDGRVTAAETVAYASNAMGALVNGREQTPDLAGGDSSYTLSSGREEGPDISDLARMLSEGEDVQFNQDGLVLGELPTLNLQDLSRGAIDGDVDLSKLSIDEMKKREELFLKLQSAKRKVESARSASQNDPTGEKQQKAWCELSEMEDPNPYRAEAEAACSQATSYVEQRRRLVIAMERDWEKVKYLMGLQSYSVDDKKKVLRAFLRSYAVLSEQKPMRAANVAWKDFKAGRAPSIVRIESAEQTGGAVGTGGVEWIFSEPVDLEFTKTEITLGQYEQCVSDGACKEKNRRTKSDYEYCNWGYSDRDDHPMNCVRWHGAKEFCKWIGGRLPTEEEWYAEASNGGAWKWPWGDRPKVSCEYAVMDNGTDGCGADRTWPVCSKTKGNSVSGLCDMSGNVWEWTSSSERTDRGTERVVRGGSWSYDYTVYLRASGRFTYGPAYRYSYFGFRCVRSSH